jgi:hypothetical protein
MEKITYYEEAMRYVEYAKEQFACSPIEERYYTDLKFVKAGGGTIYAGIEKSAKWYIELNGIKIAKNAKEPEITKQLGKINRTALNMFNDLYYYFHINVYYNGLNNPREIKNHIEIAKKFIALLKPFNKPHEYKKGGNIWEGLSGKQISNKSLK